MSSDKKTIGITASGERTLTDLVSSGHFASEMEAAKFAMAYAARLDAPPPHVDGAGTKWNVGTVDNDSSLRAVVEALYPDCDEPYRLVEQLMNEGLRLLDGGDGLPPDVVGALFSKPS